MKIPASFMQTDVVVALSIPLPAGKDGSGITFPLIGGKLLEIHDDCVVLFSENGDTMCIPDSRIQHVMKASAIARPKSGLVSSSGGPVL